MERQSATVICLFPISIIYLSFHCVVYFFYISINLLWGTCYAVEPFAINFSNNRFYKKAG